MRIDLHFQKFNLCFSVRYLQGIVLLNQILYTVCQLIIHHTNLTDFILAFNFKTRIKVALLICHHTGNQFLCRFHHNLCRTSHCNQRCKNYNCKYNQYTYKCNSYVLPQLCYVNCRNQKPSIVHISICKITALSSTRIFHNFKFLKISGYQGKNTSNHFLFTG